MFTHIDILEMPYELALSFIWIALLLLVHVLQAKKGAGKFLSLLPIAVRWAIYVFFFFALLLFGVFTNEEFIYFQF
jgi:alginate O-acetyltransferase complex protein AlgI